MFSRMVDSGFLISCATPPVRRLMAAHARSEDLIRIGAYKTGTDEELDRAVRAMPHLRAFLEQKSDERVAIQESIARLNALEL